MTEAAKSNGGMMKGCLIGGGVVIATLIGIASCSGDQQESGKAKSLAGPPISVTAQELHKTYKANEAAAQAKYGDSPILLTGTIESITLDLSDDPVVNLKTGEMFDNVMANLSESAHAEAAKLQKGQKIELRCESVGEVIGSPILQNCVFPAK